MTINRQDIERLLYGSHGGFNLKRSDIASAPDGPPYRVSVEVAACRKAESIITHFDNALQECLGVLEEINNAGIKWDNNSPLGKAQSILDKHNGLKR